MHYSYFFCLAQDTAIVTVADTSCTTESALKNVPKPIIRMESLFADHAVLGVLMEGKYP